VGYNKTRPVYDIMRHYDASMKLLMTKFDKAKKTRLSGFDSFMVESRKKAK
jgi:GTP-binding protein EngB required for normal cell division